MTVIYPYLDFSGTLAPGQTGYERSVDLPASVKYNLFYIHGNRAQICMFQPDQRPYDSDYSPHSNRNNGTQPTIEIYENVYGWVPFMRIIDLCGAYQPTSSFAYYGTTAGSFGIPPTGINISNPVRFRVSYHGYPWLDPAMSWVHVNLGLSDTCAIVRTPVDITGMGDIGLWTAQGAPLSASTRPTLPNGAPLGGRSRVQMIS